MLRTACVVAMAVAAASPLSDELAVATGSYTATPRGPGAVGRFPYTDTRQRRAGAWRCVATLGSRIASDAVR